MAFSSVGLVIGEFFWPRFQIGLDDFTVPKVITGFFFYRVSAVSQEQRREHFWCLPFFFSFFFICRRRFRAGARTKRNARSAAAPSVPFGVVTEFPYRVFVGSALFSAGRPANRASFTGPVLMSSCSTGAPWVTTRFIGRFRFRRRGPSALEVLGR